MKLKLLAIIQPINKGLSKKFSAHCPDVPGCIAHGTTEEKALAALQEILVHQLRDLEELGLEPPKQHSKMKILEVETLKEQNASDISNLRSEH